MKQTSRIPAELDDKIYEFYKKHRGIGHTYHEVAHAFNEMYGTDYPESSLRGRYQNYAEDINNPPGKSIEIDPNGHIRLFDIVKLTPDQVKSPDYVMESQGYSKEEWTVFKFTATQWGDPKKPFYSVRLELKPRDKSELTEYDIVKINENYTYRHVKVEPKFTSKSEYKGRALEIALPDIHIGSTSADPDFIKERITEIGNYARQDQINKIYLTFLGDILHVDNSNNTTVAGTQLTVKTTAQDMYLEAKDLLNFIVAELSDFETEVYWVAGNHSEVLEFALFDTLKESWTDNEHIKFSVDASLRKAFLYGTNLVGLTHGNMPKKQLFGWLASEFPELWGQAKYRELHYGHSHQEKVEENGGVVNRLIPTTKDQDDYEYRQGFQRTSKIIQCFVWDKEDGLIAIKRF